MESVLTQVAKSIARPQTLNQVRDGNEKYELVDGHSHFATSVSFVGFVGFAV
jgi:hypothetical protein